MVVAELLTKLGFQVDPRELNRGITHAKSALTELKGFIAKLGIGYAAYKIGKSVLGTARELESLNVQLKTMVGPDKATTLFKGITDYAKTTAFYVKDVTGAVSTMIQGMVAVPDIMPKIAQLGDIAMTSDQLNRLAYAYAQVNRQGYMTNYEARRFLQGGNFGVFQQFAMSEAVQQGRMKKGQEVQKGSDLDTQLRARQGELFGMAKKHQFTVGMLDQAISYATTQGGIFYRHQLEQVKTFEGAWSNMWDVLSINTGLAMQKLFPIMKQLMMFVTNLDLSWVSPMFERLAHSIQFVWKVMKTTDMVPAFQAFKEAVFALGDAFGVMVGGTQGAGEGLRTFARILGTALGIGIRFITLQVQIAGLFMKAIGWLREHNMLWGMLVTGFLIFIGIGPAIVKVTTLTLGLSTALNLAAIKAFFLQGTLTSLFTYMQMFGARSAMNAFFATSQAGMLGLVTATGFAIAKILELREAIKDNRTVQQGVDAIAWKANVQTAETELKMAQRKVREYKSSFSPVNPVLVMEAEDKVRLHTAELTKLRQNPVYAPDAPQQPDYMAGLLPQIKEMQKSIDKLYDPTKKTADNTDPSRRGGFDEASLLMTAIRGRLPSEIMNGVAEYD
jgi:hypothetical protein